MKKILKIVLICFLFLLLAKNWLYRNTIHYTPIKERKSIQLTDQELIASLQDKLKNTTITADRLIQIANETTNQTLAFTFQKASTNPNQLIKTGKANCIGYSALFNAIINFLILETNLEKELVAKHLVGQLDLLGVDLHQFFPSAFFNNHDYNIIQNKKTDAVFLIDSSLEDYLYLGGKPLK